MNRKFTIDRAERTIGDAWIGLYRGTSFISRWIQYATGGPYSHAVMFCRVNGHVDVLELRELIGGRRQSLDFHTQHWAGVIDVFQPDLRRWPEFKTHGAVTVMRDLISRPYSYKGIAGIALRKIPILRRIWPLDIPDDELVRYEGSLFCSHSVCAAARIGGGVDPCPHKPDCLVTPNDLSWSLFYEYAFTL